MDVNTGRLRRLPISEGNEFLISAKNSKQN
jgi:hypothetical protein